MVSRHSALSCLVALGLMVPRVTNAEPAEDAPVEDASVDETPPDADEASEPATAPEEQPEPAAEDPVEDPVEDPAPEDEPADEEDIDTEDSDEDIYAEGVEEDSQDEGATETPLPERLPRLQRIGWYHVLGAFTLGTTAGLLAGLAEREEDRATRIASGYDFETGAAILYRDRQAQYEEILDRGQALETSAIVVGALAGATAIAAITLFAVDARRKKPSATARRTRVGPGALEVKF